MSVDDPATSRTFRSKLEADGKGSIPITFLSDPENRTIDRYGLRDPAYAGKKVEGIPRPAVFVLDRNGRIVWSKVETDYTQRPTNAEIIAALKSTR